MLLVLLATLPSVTVAWVFVVTTLSEYSRDNEMRLQDTSRALALALDSEIGKIVTALTVLSTSTSLDHEADLPIFHTRTSRVAEVMGMRVALNRPDGTQLLATSRPYGEVRTARQQLDVLKKVVEEAQPRVTDAVVPDAGQPTVAKVYVPVQRDGKVTAVLDALLTVRQLSDLLVAQMRRPGAFAVVADGQGTIMGGTPGILPRSDKTLPRWMRDASVAVVSRGTWADGVERVCVGRPLDTAAAWRVAVCENGGEFDAAWEMPLLLRVLATLAALVSAALAAAALARRLVRPLQVLTRNAEAVASAGPTDMRMEDGLLTHIGAPSAGVAEFAALQQSLFRAERVLLRRTRAEHAALQEARTSQQLLASVVNNAAEQISVKDLDGRYLLVNRAALLALGFAPGQEAALRGRRTIDVFEAETARITIAADDQVLVSGRALTLEMPFVNVHGVARHLSMSKAPWYDADGKLAGIVTVARDMTDEREADARLRRLQAALQRATRLSAMGAMASGLAHEVNQPLAASTNFLNAAVRLLGRVRPTAQSAPGDQGQSGDGRAVTVFDRLAFDTALVAVSDASAQMLRAGEIVRRLRDFVGRGEVELQTEDIAGLLSEAVSLAQVDFGLTGVDLEVDAPASLGRVLVDRTQLLQVLLNLIRNAAEAIQGMAVQPGAMPTGRIVIAASRQADAALVITVSDNGPGFAHGVVPHLFEPFVSSKPNGMGIGLVICRTIVEGHGGKIAAQPGLAGGAVFKIIFPGVAHA